MKKAYLYFFALTVLLASCKNEDELSPSKAILGIYQQEDVEFSIGVIDELDYAKTIELKAGQKIVYQGTFRNKGESEVLGYNFYYEGAYTLDGDKVNIIYNDAYRLSDPDITYVTKEELLKLKIEPVFQDQYRITDDYQELYYVCPPNAICIPPSPYKKIN